MHSSRLTDRSEPRRGHTGCTAGATMSLAQRNQFGRLTAVLLLCVPSALAWAMPPAASPSAGKSRPRAGAMQVLLKDGKKVPLFEPASSATVVAKVGAEVITVRDLGEAIAAAHGDHDAGAKGGAPDVSQILHRLIEVRLMVSEAHAMGIDELPEFKAEVEKFTEAALRDMLKRRVAGRAKVDRKLVDRAYKEAVRERKIASVLFEKEVDAKAFEAALKAGGSFDPLAAAALADKKAKAYQQGEWMAEASLLPEVGALVGKLEQGKVSGVTKISGGFALLRVDGVRYPDSAEVRERVEADVRNAAQFQAIADFTAALVEKHARIDKKLLAALDYDGKDAPLEALAKDRRVVARVDGKAAITVAELTAAIDKKFFHGAKQAAEQKRINKEKKTILGVMLASRVLLDEARRRGLEKSEELKYLVREKRHALAFGTVVERVVVPEVKVTDADLKAFYEKHGAEYTYPAMYRLEGLAFVNAVGAEDAARKLRAGTDLAWLRANAEGQIDPAKQKIQFSGIPVDASTMPEGLGTALAGAKIGECRTWVHRGEHYVIRVADFTPPQRRPLEDVRETVHNRAYGQKVEAALAAWVDKLREHYPVEVLLASIG